MSAVEIDSEACDGSGSMGETRRRWLLDMLRIREFETRCDPLALQGRILGGVHSSVGQEAVAVGVAAALRPGDRLAGTHRSHHHALASGIPSNELMAELYGRATGCNGGRGGSMHVACLERGFIGGNGIVGAGIGLAVGAALTAKTLRTGGVAVGIVGDGGMNTGRTWESINLATIWDLPVIVVCENNLYAVETPSARMTASSSIVDRASGFGVRARVVDGQDVSAVHQAVSEAAALARAGDGPTFIEARTYRYEGHNTGQVITYRTVEELEDWRSRRDPIDRLRQEMVRSGELDDAAFDDLAAAARQEIEEAVAFAERSPWPDPSQTVAGVTDLGLAVRHLPA